MTLHSHALSKVHFRSRRAQRGSLPSYRTPEDFRRIRWSGWKRHFRFGRGRGCEIDDITSACKHAPAALLRMSHHCQAATDWNGTRHTRHSRRRAHGTFSLSPPLPCVGFPSCRALVSRASAACVCALVSRVSRWRVLASFLFPCPEEAARAVVCVSACTHHLV